MIDLEKELARVYEQGWLEAADWANRGDLAHTTGSPAYIAAREKRLTGIRFLFAGKVLCDANRLITKNENGLTLHIGWDDLPAGTKLYVAAKEQAK